MERPYKSQNEDFVILISYFLFLISYFLEQLSQKTIAFKLDAVDGEIFN
jgi:hypothetical protein